MPPVFFIIYFIAYFSRCGIKMVNSCSISGISGFWMSQMTPFFQFLFSLIGYGRRYQYDSKAFLFSLVNKPGWAPVKLPQTGKYGSSRTSLYFHYSYGPTFGAGHDIYLSNYASFGTNSYSNLGYTYYDPTGGNSYGTTFTQTFLAGSYRFTPDEIETFYETT